MTAIAARSREIEDGPGRSVRLLVLERRQEFFGFLAFEHRRLAFGDNEARRPHGERRVRCDAASLGQKVEPVAKRRSGELDARGLQRRLQFLQVRGHGRRRELTQRHALTLTPRAEAPDGAPVGFARMGIRHSGGEELQRESGHEVAGVRDCRRQRHRDAARGADDRHPRHPSRGASATRAVESGSGRGMAFPLDNVFYPLQNP